MQGADLCWADWADWPGGGRTGGRTSAAAASPVAAWRDLLILVEDVRTSLAAAASTADEGRAQQSALDVGSGRRTSRPLRARASRYLPGADEPGGHQPESPQPGSPAEEAGIDADHVESWRLVRLAQDGDGEAFGLLYDRYVDLVFRFIYYKLNDRTLAEDFTSETFTRALRRISTFSYQGRDIGAWFVTIARNLILDHLKSARNRLETSTADTVEVADRSERVRSTEAAVLDSLQSEYLMAAVNKLGDEQRECIVLRFVQGLSVSETASIMGKNDGAIKALQHRAVRKLADLVDEGMR